MEFSDPQHHWISFSARARVLIYNTDLVPEDQKPTSIHDLAKELGEPTTVSEDSWEWRFTGPGMQAAPSASALSRPVGADLTSSTGHPSSEGTNNMAWTQSFDTSIPRKECAYRAKIKGVTIVDIETVVISGRCQFSEIPPRARN